MIYLATPYSHPSAAVRQWRYEQAQALWWHYVQLGLQVYSPIVHTHPAAVKFEAPQGYEFYRHFDEQMILSSEQLWIAHIPGWEESKGMASEIKFALNHKVPCVNITEAPSILEMYDLLQFPGE